MKITEPTEFYFYTLLLNWNHKASDSSSHNQINRMIYLLGVVSASIEERTYQTLSRYCRRHDGESYISKNCDWMGPHARPLREGWYLHDNISLKQKQAILNGLSKLGYSSGFRSCVDAFVAGQEIDQYMPSANFMNQWIPPFSTTSELPQ